MTVRRSARVPVVRVPVVPMPVVPMLAAAMLVAALVGCTHRTVAGPTRTAPAVASASTGLASAPPGLSEAPTSQVVVTFESAPSLAVEVADTPEARALGLMHRDHVPAGTGMLFVFPGPSTGGFWMKNTLVPLSIAYVRGDRVVSTAEMVPCPPATKACPAYDAAAAYTSAVEAPAGFFPAHGIGPGTRVSVQGRTATPQ